MLPITPRPRLSARTGTCTPINGLRGRCSALELYGLCSLKTVFDIYSVKQDITFIVIFYNSPIPFVIQIVSPLFGPFVYQSLFIGLLLPYKIINYPSDCAASIDPLSSLLCVVLSSSLSCPRIIRQPHLFHSNS